MSTPAVLPPGIFHTKVLDEQGYLGWAWQQFLQRFLTPANAVIRVAVPATSSSAGELNQIAVAAGFLYVCIGHNSWKRVALSNF